MEFKIEKNQPIPTSLTSRFPFAEMEVGDSFLAYNQRDSIKQSSISTTARMWASTNKKDWKFTVRQVDEGIRIWRKE